MGNASPRLLIIFTGATVLVVALVIALATDNWIFLPIALVVHALGTVLVMASIGKRVADDPEPDPLVKERLEEEEATTK